MTRGQFRDLAKRFEDWTNALKQEAERSAARDSDTVPDAVIERIVQSFLDRAPMAEFRREAPIQEGPPEAGFDDFLETLSQSMVTAQKKLDAASAEYLLSIRERPEVQPAVFRLPRLEAQMKVGLDVKEGQRLNLLFWGKDRQTSQLNQQGLSFELVAVPAAPGAVEAARRSLTQWLLVVDPARRKELLAQVSAVPSTPAVKPLLDAAGDATEKDAVAFLDLADGTRLLVLYANDESEKNVGLWLLTRAAAGATLDVIYSFTRKNSDSEPLLRELVLELAARQRQLAGK